MDPVLIGYFPKSISLEPAYPGVEGVYSVSGCVSRGPAGWIDLWRHNDMALFDTEAVAESVLRDAFLVQVDPDPGVRPPWKITLQQPPFVNGRMLAYKVYPIHFCDEGEEELALPELNVTPLPGGFERLGYDPVEYQGGCVLSFGCSPLSCNGRAGDLRVNRHCLFDDREAAFEAAREFATSKGTRAEPGPYVVVEVWARPDRVLDRAGIPEDPQGLTPELIRHRVRGALRSHGEAKGKIGA